MFFLQYDAYLVSDCLLNYVTTCLALLLSPSTINDGKQTEIPYKNNSLVALIALSQLHTLTPRSFLRRC